jgi:hypothetical protein
LLNLQFIKRVLNKRGNVFRFLQIPNTFHEF